MYNDAFEKDLASNSYELENPDRPAGSGLFVVKTANDWIDEAKKRPMPKTLFGDFWNEGELCILFGDTGKGKSILAVQIAESIASGRSIDPLPLTAMPQKVLYFDFELSDKQFEGRYSERPATGDFHINHYEFSPNLLRIEINRDAEVTGDFDDFLADSLEQCIATSGAKIVIVDNLTYLRTATEQSKDALPLMKELKRLKAKFDLSILALAHTPKRDPSQPLVINHLQGSKMLGNFSDNIFAIGESYNEKNVRYLKHIKPRSTEMRYGEDNICVFELEKPANFLYFRFREYGVEREHLRPPAETDRSAQIEKARALSNSGRTQREIATELGVSLGAVNKYLRS